MQPVQGYLNDAAHEVNLLSQIALDDDVPSIQAANLSVSLECNTNTNFNDIIGLKSASARPSEDARIHACLNKVLEKGYEYAGTLYTWRPISRAIPFIRSSDEPNRIKIYEKTKEILEPHCEKLKGLMYFQENAIDLFVNEVKRHSHKDKQCSPNKYSMNNYAETLKMFAVLDEMKNMKASIKNDYSTYKRAAQFLQLSDPESQDVTMFLAQQRIIRDTLKDRLSVVDGYVDVLIKIILHCCYMYENNMYVLPDEKHTFVVAIAISLYLIDSPTVIDGKQTGVNFSKVLKQIDVRKIDRIFKNSEAVRLFGDMSVEPYSYVRQTPSFDPSKWPECQSSKVSSQGALLIHMPKFREEYTSLTADLAWNTNITSIRLTEPSAKENRELCNLALKSLQRLSCWSTKVLDTIAWKLNHGANEFTNPECPKNAENYEKATRYNYTSDEKFALIECISMIKSIQAQLLKLEACYSEAIRHAVYVELQTLLFGPLQALLSKAKLKKKRVAIVRVINAVQAICIDTSIDSSAFCSTGAGGLTQKSWSKATSSKFSTSNNNLSVRSTALGNLINTMNSDGISNLKRHVPPSYSQLYLIRAMLELLLDENSFEHSMRKELDSATLSTIETFLMRSYYWPYLLNFTDTLNKCCDLSQLWYREFFLEITNGACIQFPIEMSLPFIFIDHVLKTEHSGFIDYILYLLDLYNDAADCALSRFHRRFLFDEIEAEADLVFKQMLYKLSNSIFRHYKRYSASILLDKRFRVDAQRASLLEPYPTQSRYATALKRQHSVQLVGRVIDLNKLISQRLNAAIFKSLEFAIERFRSRDITGIIELEATIECNRICHRMLSEHFSLDNFTDLLNEANNLVTSPMGKISAHLFWEMIFDLVGNYCFNGSTNRFVRAKFTLAEVLEREKPPTVETQYAWGSKSLNICYESIFKLYSGFVGAPHFAVICRLSGYWGLYTIISELMKVAKSLLNQTLRKYVCRLVRLMPSSLKLPPTSQGSDVLFSYIYKQLCSFYQLADLRTNVCHGFRKLGNIIICISQLENNLANEDLCDLRHAGPFIRQLPAPYIPPLPGHNGKAVTDVYRERELLRKQEAMNFVDVVSKVGTEQQLALAKEHEILTKERLCSNLSLMGYALEHLKSYLHEEDSEGYTWNALDKFLNTSNKDCGAQTNSSTDVLGLLGFVDFHRIWSGIQLVFCTSFGPNEYTVEEMFGDGLNWGGCAIIRLLDQQRLFEMFDLGGLLLRLQCTDKKDNTPEGISLERLATRLSCFGVLNQQIFATLNNYMNPPDRQLDLNEAVRQFPLPTWSRS